MSAETDFQALLDGHAALTDLVDDRIALAAVADGAGYPCVVYLAQHDPTFGVGGTVLADLVTFTVQCWADDEGGGAVGAAAVAAAVRGAIATAPGARSCAVVGEAPAYDEQTGLDGVLLTVEWWASV